MIAPDMNRTIVTRLASLSMLPALLVCALLWSASPTHAQAGAATSTVSGIDGTVLTSERKPIKGAVIELKAGAAQTTHTFRSAEDGSFRLGTLPPGEYTLTVSAAGFKTFLVAQVQLSSSGPTVLEIQMEAGDPASVTTGSIRSPASSTAGAVTGKAVSDLPENQRNFVNLVQVSSGATEGSTNSAASGSRPGAQHQSSAVSVGGQSEMANNSQIDGMDNNERINAAIIVHPSVESIANVQVLANAYAPSMGQAGGAVVNVVTRTGGEHLHGSIYEFFRNDRLDAYPYQFGANNPKPRLRQNQFGGSIGGPVGGKLRFFADYEGFRLIQGYAPTTLTVPTTYQQAHPGDFTDVGGPLLSKLDPVGLAYFKLYPAPNVLGKSDQFVSSPTGSNLSHAADARIDLRSSKHDALFMRGSFNMAHLGIPGQLPAVALGSSTVYPGAAGNGLPGGVRDVALNSVVGYSRDLRKNLLLNLLAGYTLWSEDRNALNPDVPVNALFGQPNINLPNTSNGLAPVRVTQAASLGADGYYNIANQLNDIFQYGGSISYARKSHTLTAGSQFIRRQWTNFDSGAGLGMWTVRDLPSLLQGQFSQVYREVNLVAPHFRASDFDAYLQDEWRPAPRLSVSLGVRYDLMTQPTEARNQIGNIDLASGRIILAGQPGVSATANVRTDQYNLAPRTGFSFDVGRSTRVVGGYGMVAFRPVSYFVFASQPFIYTFGVCSSQTCPANYNTLAKGLPVPVSPDITNPAGVEPDTRAFDLHASTMHQFNLGVEQQLLGTQVSAFYVSAIGQHVGRTFNDINAPPPNTSAAPQTHRPLYSKAPNLTIVKYRDAGGYSSYNALQLRLSRAAGHGVTLNTNYTFAHALDNVSTGGFGAVPSQSNVLDYGNSSIDVRQRFVATILYDLPFGKAAHGLRKAATQGWQVNLAAVWSTGLPFTVVNAINVSNTNPGSSGTDRPNQLGSAKLTEPTVKRYFNTNAFVAQAFGSIGSERGNQLYGPAVRHLDASIFKTFELPNHVAFQLRTELFNLTNTSNFASPNSVLGGANFGQLTQLTGGYTPRQVQVAARLSF